jgi:hypothetical protein
MSPSTMTGALLAAAAVLAFSAAVEARPGRASGGTIEVCSRYGNGCVSGPTRPGRFGDREVRMPGGTWIACKLDCRQTLREETIDFFETLRERAPSWR